MNKKFKLLSLVFAIIIFISSSGSHPVGRSGAPGDGLCSDCHGGGGAFSGTIDIIGLPAEPSPGQIYDLTVELDVSSGSPVRGGFQVVALRDANNTQAGTWSNPDNSSSLKTSSGRVYFGHQPFRTFGGGNTVSWDAEWQAPNITDDVTFYMAGNLANGNGSSSGDAIIVNEVTVSITEIEMMDISFDILSNISCPGENDGAATAIVSGGVPPYSYAWENGYDTATAFELAPGPNSVTVTDDNGSQVTAEVNILEPDPIDADIFVTDLSCFDERDGVIDVEAFGGTGTLTCTWETLFDDCFQDGLDAGVYFLTITDENDCFFETEIVLTQPDELILSMSSTDAGPANNDGTASCTPAGGTADYRFSWSNGVIEVGASSTITGLSQGEYDVTVTDANGCFESETVTVGGTSCNINLSMMPEPIACYGDSTGLISVVVSNATLPISYVWSEGSITDSLINVPAGTYSVTVTDANGCTAIDTTVLIQSDSLFLDSLTVLHNVCAMDMSGEISFVPKGGKTPYALVWSNGLVNDTLVNGTDTLINYPDTLTQLGSGFYSLTLTDANNCTLIDSFEIRTDDREEPVIDIQDIEWFITVDGSSAELDLGDLTVSLSDNCAIDSVNFEPVIFDCSMLGTNTLNARVTDTNGNSAFTSFEVNVLDITPPVIDCNNEDIAVNTCDEIIYAAPSASDNCSTVVIQQIAGLASGESFPEGETVNTFLVTDGSGNTASCSFTVTLDSDLDVNYTVENASCAGDDGTIILDITGGNPPYTIVPEQLENIAPGNYTINVTDASGCFYEEEVFVGQDEPSFDYSVIVSDVSCKGEMDGNIELILSNTDPNDDYFISLEDGSSLNGLEAGEYTVVIETANDGCLFMEPVTVGEPDEALLISVDDFNTDPCTMMLLDSELSASGGTVPYSFDIQQSSEELVFTVTDANGCTDESRVPVSIPDEFLSLQLISIMDADNGDNGSIEIQAQGGVPPYSYIWTDENGTVIASDNILSGLDEGIYTVIVSDAAGCELAPSSYRIDRISSTEEAEFEIELEIYPVPVRALLTVETVDNLAGKIQLIDKNGRICQTYTPLSNRSSIDVSALPEGMYILRCQFKDGIVYRKFLKL